MEKGVPSSKESKDDRSSYAFSKGAKKYQSQKNVEKVSIPPKEI